MGDYLLSTSACANPVSRRRAGGARRQSEGQLPCVLLAYDKRAKEVLGAFVLERCLQVAGEQQLTFIAASFVGLAQPIRIEASMCEFQSAVFKLKPEAEERVRFANAVGGAPLIHQFSSYAGTRWKVLACSPSHLTALGHGRGEEVTLHAPISWSRCLGVRPEAVDRVPDRIAEEEVAASMVVVGEELVVPGVASSGEGVVAVVSTSAQVVPSTVLAVEEHGGTVEHRFSVSSVLSCLQFSAYLKPGATVRGALAAAAPILQGPEGDRVAQQLRDGETPVPSIDLMRMARLRLDFMSIMFERQLFMQFQYRRYILVDSSPQLGFNFLCCREDRVRFPRGDFGADFRRAYDINAAFESRLFPLSTLGVGAAGLVKKGINVANVYVMESESLDKFHEVRCEIRGFTSDQGTERKLPEVPVAILSACRDAYEPSDPMSYMYPRCLAMPGHLHILFNALEEAVKSLSISAKFLERLRSLQSFLSNRQLRQRFQAT